MVDKQGTKKDGRQVGNNLGEWIGRQAGWRMVDKQVTKEDVRQVGNNY